MDYSKLSDFEINKRVATSLGYRLYKDGSSCQHNYVSVEDYGKCGSISMEWCNNPAEAWPIITSNRIALSPLFGGEWRASVDDECGFISYTCSTENPLRAAMTVFIMLQGSSNVQDNPSR
ncbi:phage protein NinX family protein [Enterobacter cloacae complex sp. IR5459]|uniref:phage protein NinX family protein n=1 Tax=Enterobacter cloacae complex sp. IR5459 TaxID=3412376 RepID=UPI0037DBF832